jgi:hypothetical protein
MDTFLNKSLAADKKLTKSLTLAPQSQASSSSSSSTTALTTLINSSLFTSNLNNNINNHNGLLTQITLSNTSENKTFSSADSKLLESINILKHIIERISKTVLDNKKYEIGRNEADSFDNLFALAKNSVTLSFKDYLKIQKATLKSTATTIPALQLTLTRRNHLSPTKKPIGEVFIEKTLSPSFKFANKFNNHNSLHFPNISFPRIDTINTSLNKELNTSRTQSPNNSSFLNTMADQRVSLVDMMLWYLNDSVLQSSNSTNYTSPFGDTNNKILFDLNEFLMKKDFDSFDSSILSYELQHSLNNNNNNNNGSNNSHFLIGMTFFYSILIITSITSNPLLIYVLLWKRKAQIKLIDIFVANLSLSDLFLTIFNIPLILIIYFSKQWPLGSLLCQLGTYSTSCSIYVNIFTMAYISVDRYFAVTRPLISNPARLRKKSVLLDHHTRKKIYLSLCLIWIVALVLSLPQFLYSKVSKLTSESEQSLADHHDLFSNTTDSHEFEADLNMLNYERASIDSFGEDPFKKCILIYPLKNMKHYMVIINFSLQYLIPSCVILYFYGKIIYHLYLNLNVEEFMDSSDERKTNNHKDRKQPKANESVKKSRSSNDIERINCALDGNLTLLNAQNSLSENVLQDRIITSVDLRPQKTRMRVDGLNRTQNLKKSIKTMIIIITLFLLSWLPIHLYRLVTTFYPLIIKFLNSFSSADASLSRSLNDTYELCNKNLSTKECLFDVIREIGNKDHNSYRLNTLHNRFAFFFSYFMAMSSVCYNPIVYFWMHKKFRADVKQIFKSMLNFNFLLKLRQTKRSTSSERANLNEKRLSTVLLDTSRSPNGTKFSLISSRRSSNEPSCAHQTRQQNRKRKEQNFLHSFKVRSKRFNSLSSESTTTSSSTRRSEMGS